MNQRIDELEIKLTLQEQTIDELNSVITGHEQRLSQLEQQLRLLHTQLKTITSSNVTPAGEEPPPPHY
ncbi:MAG: SlyX family protein [Gammaproteobacteria bacterium]|nr:SlyX family protein [Gammaproteobacteria bacterium]